LDRDIGGVSLACAADAFGEGEGSGRIPAIDGERAPGLGHLSLRHIDLREADELCLAEFWEGPESDRLVGGGGLRPLCEGDLCGLGRMEGAEGDQPATGSELGLHGAALIDRDGEGRVDAGELPACGQDRAERLLAALACNDQLDLRLEPEGDPVLEDGVDLEREEVLIDGLRGGLALEPEGPIGVPGRGIDLLSGDGQIEQADLWGQGELLWHLVPGEAAVDLVFAGRELDGRSAGALDDRDGLAIEGDGGGPVASIAGQGQPGIGEGGDLEGECGAGGGDLEQEARGPEAEPERGVVVGGRASEIGQVPGRPAGPWEEWLGQRGRERCE